MIKTVLTLSLLLAVTFALPRPQGEVANAEKPSEKTPPLRCRPMLPPPPPGANGQGLPPGAIPPPGANGQGLPPPPQDFENLPLCPPTLVSGHCGGKTYWWDTATETEPEDFKKCFYSDGPVSAACNGKEYTWDPAKEDKPKELAECEKNFLARQ